MQPNIDSTQIAIWREIASEIANGRAVAFVGAGVGATVGLPTWEGLIRDQIQEAQREHGEIPDVKKLIDVFQRGDLTLSAALLKRLRGRQFTEHLKRTFATSQPAGFAHRAVARLPFSQLITTNYDPLMERAYDPPIADALTYTEPNSILERIANNEFCIIKLHGHLSDLGRAVMTEDDFRTVQRFQPLMQCLRIIALTKRLVFIGHGLRDPDLLNLLSDLKTEFPNSGPHFAILDDDEREPRNTAPGFLAQLEQSLGVRAVVCRYSSPSQNITGNFATTQAQNSRTLSLVQHLNLLHAEVCARRAVIRPQVWEDRNAGIRRQMERLLQFAANETGSVRGDLAFLNDKYYSGWARARLGSKELSALIPGPGLYVECSFGPTARSFTGEEDVGSGARWTERPDRAYPGSVIWTSFHYSREPLVIDDVLAHNRDSASAQVGASHGSQLASDPDTPDLDETSVDPGNLAYREGDTRVISELATPIYVGDNRIGVLNLEPGFPFWVSRTPTVYTNASLPCRI